jgi:hypothetical protein
VLAELAMVVVLIVVVIAAVVGHMVLGNGVAFVFLIRLYYE